MALKIPHMSLGQVLVLADEDDGRNPKLLRLVLLQSLANDLRLADVSARCVGKGVAANENVTPALSSSSRARSSSSSVRGAATALPVQLEISAVRRLFASPRGRKSLIVADVMCSIRQDVPVAPRAPAQSTCCSHPTAAAVSSIRPLFDTPVKLFERRIPDGRGSQGAAERFHWSRTS